MINKGLLILLAVFCTLVGLLVLAKSRPAAAHGANVLTIHETVTVA